MASLNRKELEEEIFAIKNVIEVHKKGIELNAQGLKVNLFLLNLVEKELTKLPAVKAKV